ncbi:MAG TPA: PIG-L family deacetylase [Chloroflexota bacterium]|nr:PIG-L family deacetylase [Chloroflexota bacterium]
MGDLSGNAPLTVISPHLDDGVFGCGQLLATHPGSVVVTALAGRPRVYPPLTKWDAAAGFQPGDDVVALRREEDRAALRHLAARPVWLEFCDAQYDPPPAVEVLAAALAEAIGAAGLDTVVLPLGLFHSDHALTHAAALQVRQQAPHLGWWAYEEPNYRRVDGLLDERLEALRQAGIAAAPAGRSTSAGAAAKRRAAREYRSQLRALTAPGMPGYADVFAPEEYWRLDGAS